MDEQRESVPTEFPTAEQLADALGGLAHAVDAAGCALAPPRLAYELRRLADEVDPPDQYREDCRAWSCLIGYSALPPVGGLDASMREAVEKAYREVTGNEPGFVFSGWGATLSAVQRRSLMDVSPPASGSRAEGADRG